MQAQRLAGALGKQPAVRGERAEAADVDVPQVQWRLALVDPLRDQAAGAAGVGDAGRVEARGDSNIQLVASPRMRLYCVGREALQEPGSI